MAITKQRPKLDLDTLQVDKQVQAHGYKLCYNDKAHKYWIEYPTGEKNVVYGMTTVQKPIGSISFNKETGAVSSKTDTLMAWAVKMCREAVIDWFNKGNEFTVSKLEELFKSHTNKSDYSKDFGHTVHSLVEQATAKIMNGEMVEWDESDEAKIAKKIIDNDTATNTHVIAQELLVFAPSNPQDPPEEWGNWIAGTFDRLVMRNGTIELQDHKTSTGVYDLNYYVQLRGYQFMLEWMIKDQQNTYANQLQVLQHNPISARRINLATKTGYFTDSWVSTNDLDDYKMFQATLDIFNISKKYRALFWDK